MEIREEMRQALQELLAQAHLSKGDVLVIGCSTSEVAGEPIGSHPSATLGQELARAALEELRPLGIWFAAQCCEHLNRALVVEAACARAHGWEVVNAIPVSHAGGAFAQAAYEQLDEPVLVESIQADAGLDIGTTLIGMHLKRVAVPVRLRADRVGCASVVAARVRPKYTGGPRAIYDDRLM